ncbi:MAG TPA: nitrophenyl compound nitroreductase subunit ArsF family protein [Lentimicrobium sp.]|nr:nitrophenyl compound nitroreductase subunit ArsF family protein [Lentimicrobium sp.]
MKTLYSILAFFLLIPLSQITAKTNTDVLNSKPADIKVYYFHYERRCATCIAVEEESRKALVELYPTFVKKGRITFQSVNLEEKSGEALADRFKVAGQSLIIVKDDQVRDITEKGFLYAKSEPEKLKAEIKKEVDALLK